MAKAMRYRRFAQLYHWTPDQVEATAAPTLDWMLAIEDVAEAAEQQRADDARSEG